MHAGMPLKEIEGSTILRALRALGVILVLQENNIAAVTVGVTRTPLVPITLHHR